MVTNYETLTDAETALSALKSDKEAVDAVVEKINAIGTVTLDKEAKIAEARAAYNALTDARKEMVTNYKTLTDTEAALTALKSQNDQSGNPDNPKTGDTTSIPLAILMLASSAGMCALLLKRRTTAE